MRKLVVGPVGELPPGSRKIVEYQGRSYGVFNVDGKYYAIRNRCPHQAVPLCKGQLGGTFLPSQPQEFIYGLEGAVLTCPAHRWQFDLTDGRSIAEPDKVSIKRYPVEIEDDHVVIVGV